MQEIKTQIEIEAPTAKVCEIIENVDQWHQWSPIINGSSGKPSLGEQVNITMTGKEKGSDGPKYSPTIIALEKEAVLHWRAKMMAGFIFTNDKIFELSATEKGTHLIHIETFKGLMAPLMSKSVAKNVPAMLDSMNLALKALAEQ